MCFCCGKEKRIVNDYLEAINEVKKNSSFLKETSEDEKKLPQNGEPTEIKPALTDNVSVNKKVYEDRLNHYEKLYRCYIDSYRAKTSRIATIVIIIVSFLLIGGTVALCAFGPNFRGQEDTNTAITTTSSNTVVVGGYANRGSYGYTYFQESKNGRR